MRTPDTDLSEMSARQLRAATTKLRAVAEHHLARRQAKLAESLGDFWPTRYATWQNVGVPLSNPDIYLDRSKTIRNLPQLHLAQNKSQELSETNPNAKGIVKALVSYTVGAGGNVSVVSDDDAAIAEATQKRILKIIKKFKKTNKWREVERDMERRLHVHGEFFLRLYPDEDNVTKVRFVEPQCIQPPAGESWDGPWSWGIRHVGDDVSTPAEYNIRYFREGQDEQVEAIFIIHVKVNSLTNSKRGIPSFYSCDDELRGVNKVRWASREGEAVRRAIAFFRQWDPAVGKSAVEAMANAAATDFMTPSQLPAPSDALQFGLPSQAGEQIVRVEKLDGPSVVDTSAKIANPPSVSFEGAEIVVDQSLQAVAASMQIPEWVTSGKTDVSSYAASLTTESPFTKTIEDDQGVLGDCCEDLFTRVIEIAAEQGELSQADLDDATVRVVYNSPVVRNKSEETTRRKTLNGAGILSRDTWAHEEGYDYEEEQAKISLEPQPAEPDQGDPATGKDEGRSQTQAAQSQRAT